VTHYSAGYRDAFRLIRAIRKAERTVTLGFTRSYPGNIVEVVCIRSSWVWLRDMVYIRPVTKFMRLTRN
jgi:hypothetical protein